MDVIDRVDGLGSTAGSLRQEMVDARLAARRYTRDHGEDDPAISGWTWDTGYTPDGRQSTSQDRRGED
jgi:xylulose-5-phosphate/fructose-6-phosphate phosphoketolase